MRGARQLRALFSRGPEPLHPLLQPTDEDHRYVTSLYDDSVPLPEQAYADLRSDNPQLLELRSRYDGLDLPVLDRSRWDAAAVESFLDLRWFRGETLFVWHYREMPRITRLKYFVYLRYIADQDQLGLLERLEEDGMFGCWTFQYPGWGMFSRDLLQSINEINFLDRQLGLSSRSELRVFDIGAGYGRLAHRMTTALGNVADYCCVDAVAEATFLSDWYLRFRGCHPAARAVALDRLDTELEGDRFDLAVNMHSFSECPLAAVQWWVDRLERLEIPNVLIVPNEPDALLATESDGTRSDFMPLLTRAGYELAHTEPVVGDEAVRELLPLNDQFFLFSRR